MEGRAVVLPYQQMVFESFISGSAGHVLTEINISKSFSFSLLKIPGKAKLRHGK
jgi:hypothetical protein